MSVLDGPGEGTWSVFAAKVVEERDQLRDHVESLKAQLECAQTFHNVALRERDLAITQLRHAEADAELAVAYAEQERERAERERDEARAALAAARREGAEAMREAAAQLFDEEARAWGAKLGTQDAERAVRIRALPLPSKARCACQWEAGDSPCPTHGDSR